MFRDPTYFWDVHLKKKMNYILFFKSIRRIEWCIKKKLTQRINVPDIAQKKSNIKIKIFLSI